jgi:Phytanoyl-CoA dioxygenase (PhyH)
MNHITDKEERKYRWYAHESLKPRYITVEPATVWLDLLQPPTYLTNESESVMYSLPISWLGKGNCTEEKSDGNTSDGINNNEDMKKKLWDVLELHGFIVISNVLTSEECEQAIGLSRNWITACQYADLGGSEQARLYTKVEEQSQSSPSLLLTATSATSRTLTADEAAPFFPSGLEGGFLPFYGSGHTMCAWSIRSNPRVCRAFECLYATTNLLASLDGCVLWQTGMERKTDRGWFHLDQNPACKPHPASLQGLVSVLDVSESTGGNVIVAQSHHLFPHHYLSMDGDCAGFYSTRLQELNGDDWLEIDKNDSMILNPQKVLALQLHAGDMLMWDSRVVHTSYPADPESPPATPYKGLVRAAWAVTFMPEAEVSQATVQSRREAVRQARTLTHWVNKVAPLGAECAEQVAREQGRIDGIHKWEEQTGQKVLLGFEDMSERQRQLVIGKQGIREDVQ